MYHDEYYFERLEERLTEISYWEGTIEIAKEEYEYLLSNNSDLENHYIELYSSKSRVFGSEVGKRSIV